jgi:hypothetical protein
MAIVAMAIVAMVVPCHCKIAPANEQPTNPTCASKKRFFINLLRCFWQERKLLR